MEGLHENQDQDTGLFKKGNRGRPKGIVGTKKRNKKEIKALQEIREKAAGDVMMIYAEMLKNTDIEIDKKDLIKICRDLAPFQASKMATKDDKKVITKVIVDHSAFNKGNNDGNTQNS